MAYKNDFPTDFFSNHLFHSLIRILMLLVTHKAKVFGFPTGNCHDLGTQGLTRLDEKLFQTLISHLFLQVFDIYPDELLGFGPKLDFLLF